MSPHHEHGHCGSISSADGFSLIELMVALAIGTLLIIGAVTVYTQSRTTYRTTEAAARIQEVARYAMDTIEPDVRLAGYWGLTNRADFFDATDIAKPAQTQTIVDSHVIDNCGINWTADLSNSVDARDALATGGPGFNLSCSVTNPVNWADILIVRRVGSETSAL
jgi:type IV pilus assembly protein PilW